MSNPSIDINILAFQLLEDLNDPAVTELHDKVEILTHYLKTAYEAGVDDQYEPWWGSQDADYDADVASGRYDNDK